MVESVDVHLDHCEKEIVVIGLPIASLIRPVSVAKEMIESIIEVEIGAISEFNCIRREVFLWSIGVDECVGQYSFFFLPSYLDS